VVAAAIAVIAAIVGRSARAETGESLSYIFAVAACASVAAFFVVMVFYKDPPVAAGTPVRPRRSVGRILLDMVLVLRNGRFTLFLILMSGFFFVYNQVYNVLPLYAKRVVEPSPAMDLYTAANPFVIVCLQLAITQYFGKVKAIRSIVVGTVIIGVSMIINVYPIYASGGTRALVANALPLGSVFVILTVALIAFGELFTSARMYEYIGSLAPKGQEGLFLGYANLPLALGSLAGGPAGAFIFNGIMARGATTRPDGLLELVPAQNALGWIVLMGIGFLSALAMWLFNRWLERRPDGR
jgi:proton-dependent oligopeptide transporter, POT family